MYTAYIVLGQRGRRAEEADGNVFFSKQERLLNPCLQEHGGLREGGREGRGREGRVHSDAGDSGIWMA